MSHREEIPQPVKDVQEPVRRGNARSERNRERILEVSFPLLMSQGPDALSVTNICRLAVVSRQTFYRHFPTRGALMGALQQHVLHKITGAVRRAIEKEPRPEHRISTLMNVTKEVVDFAGQLSKQDTLVLLDLISGDIKSLPTVAETLLAPAFDLLEALHGRRMNRPLAAQLVVRLTTSLYLFPDPPLCADPARVLNAVILSVIAFMDPPTEAV